MLLVETYRESTQPGVQQALEGCRLGVVHPERQADNF